MADIDVTHIKSYVINLKKNIEKYTFLQKNLATINIRPERFNGIYGKDLSNEYIDSVTYPSVQFTIDHGRTVDNNIGTLGGIGCYLSHVNLWKKIGDSSEDVFLILEDDAAPSIYSADEINRFLNSINKADPDWDAIYLGWAKPFYSSNNDIKISNDIYKINEITFQTHAYLINKKGAKKLLEKAFPIVDQVDSYLSFMAMYRNFRSYRGNVSYIVQNNVEGSDIQTDFSIKIYINQLSNYSIKICSIVIMIVIILLLFLCVYFYKKSRSRE